MTDFTEGVDEALKKAEKKDISRGCEYKWVIAVYTPFSDRGKSVLAHAEIGIGYILQNKNRLKGDNVIVAFKYPAHKLLPDTLTYATPEQVYRLENKYGSKG